MCNQPWFLSTPCVRLCYRAPPARLLPIPCEWPATSPVFDPFPAPLFFSFFRSGRMFGLRVGLGTGVVHCQTCLYDVFTLAETLFGSFCGVHFGVPRLHFEGGTPPSTLAVIGKGSQRHKTGRPRWAPQAVVGSGCWLRFPRSVGILYGSAKFAP